MIRLKKHNFDRWQLGFLFKELRANFDLLFIGDIFELVELFNNGLDNAELFAFKAELEQFVEFVNCNICLFGCGNCRFNIVLYVVTQILSEALLASKHSLLNIFAHIGNFVLHGQEQ
jgi:hypothetical protein